MAVVALSVATVAHLANNLDIGAALVTAGAATALLWCRRLFVVGPGPARLARVVRVTAAAVAVDVLYGTVHSRRRRSSLANGGVHRYAIHACPPGNNSTLPQNRLAARHMTPAPTGRCRQGPGTERNQAHMAATAPLRSSTNPDR